MHRIEKPLDIKTYPPEVQGVGEFDGGRITETKPLGFPGEGPRFLTRDPCFTGPGLRPKVTGKLAFILIGPLKS